MGYFGGLGAGKGWYSFAFILTPNELEHIFSEITYSLIGVDHRVELDYTETPKQAFFEAYKQFFEQILIGQQPLSKQEAWNIEQQIRESIIDSLDKIAFTEIKDNKGGIVPFKRVEPLEPVINIAPFYLSWSAEQEKLSTAYMNDDGMIGLRLEYPKYITRFDSENPETIETNLFETRNLFNTLITRIKTCAHKAKVQTPVKLFNPNFWISTNAAALINQNRYLRGNQLEIK